jgi:hypothetical protein
MKTYDHRNRVPISRTSSIFGFVQCFDPFILSRWNQPNSSEIIDKDRQKFSRLLLLASAGIRIVHNSKGKSDMPFGRAWPNTADWFFESAVPPVSVQEEENS